MAMLDNHTHKQPVHEFDGIIENRVNRPPVYFSLLFYGLILWGVAFSAYYLLSGWSSSAEYAEKKAAHEAQLAATTPAQTAAAQANVDPAAQVAAGKELFASHCAGCHGAEAKGGIGPDLTTDNYKFGRNHDEVWASIHDGRPGGMPGFGNQLSADQVEELVAFCLSLH